MNVIKYKLAQLLKNTFAHQTEDELSDVAYVSNVEVMGESNLSITFRVELDNGTSQVYTAKLKEGYPG